MLCGGILCFWARQQDRYVASSLLARIDQGKQLLRISLFGVDHHLRTEVTEDVVAIWAVGGKRVDAMMSSEEAEEDDRMEL